jgi:hypothetical protein
MGEISPPKSPKKKRKKEKTRKNEGEMVNCGEVGGEIFEE